MDVNETMNKYLSHIKDFRDNHIKRYLVLVSITLKGLLRDYKIFISALAARQTPPTFAVLDGILVQER